MGSSQFRLFFAYLFDDRIVHRTAHTSYIVFVPRCSEGSICPPSFTSSIVVEEACLSMQLVKRCGGLSSLVWVTILKLLLFKSTTGAFVPSPRTPSLAYRLIPIIPSPNSFKPVAAMARINKVNLRETALKAKNEDDAPKDKTLNASSSWLVSLVLPLWLVYTSNQ